METKNIYYWSRTPGKFVDKHTGQEVNRNNGLAPGAQFPGTVREWFETLMETIVNCQVALFRKHLQYPSEIEVGRDVLTILECFNGYKLRGVYNENRYWTPAIDIAPQYNGFWFATLDNSFKIVKNLAIPPDELRVVLNSNVKMNLVDGSKDSGNSNKINIEELPNCQRIDQWTIKVLDLPAPVFLFKSCLF